MQQPRSPRSSATRWRAVHTRLAALMVCAALASAAPARAERQACLAAHEQGQLARLQGRFAEARTQLTSCTQPACPKLLREDCRALLADLDASRATVVLEVAGARGEDLREVRVLANEALVAQQGGQTVTLDPGTYTLRFEAADHRSLAQTLVLREGEKSRVVRVQLEAGSAADAPQIAVTSDPGLMRREAAVRASERSARRLRVASYVLGGSALAVLGAGIGLGAKGKAEHDRLSDVCGSTRPCDRDDTRKGRNLYVAADVAFGVSGALAAAAITTFLVDYLRDDADTQPARAALDAQLQTGGASLLYRQRF
jgi:hypothetical protein